MTDDLSIKQRPSALPYLAGGALLGTGAGFVANHTVPQLKGTPMSHEDIIKEVKDTTSFSNRTAEGAEHAASWKEVGEKYEAWQKAEKGVPTDQQLVEKYNNALSSKNETIKTYTEEAMRDAERGKGIAEVRPWNELAEAPKIEGKTLAEVETIYNEKITAYNDAVTAAKSDAKYKSLEGKYNAAKSIVNDANSNAYNKISKLSKKKDVNKTWNEIKGQPSRAKVGSTPLRPATGLYAEAEKAIVMDTNFLRNFEGAEVDLTSRPKDTKGLIVKEYKIDVRQPDGKVVQKKRWVAVDKKAAETALRDAQKAYVEELLTGAREHVRLQTELDGLSTSLAKKHQAAFDKFATGVAVDVGALDAKALEADVKALKKIHGIDASRWTTTEADLVRKYSTAGKAGKALGYAEAQLKAATEFAAETTRLEAEIKEVVASNSRVSQAQGAMDNFITRNKGVKKALGELKRQFGELFSTSTGASITESEAATKALERFNKSEAGRRFAELAQKYEEAAAKNVNKEAAASAKGEFEKVAKELGAKYCKGKAKWMAPAAGAVVLGLCALGLRPKAEA